MTLLACVGRAKGAVSSPGWIFCLPGLTQVIPQANLCQDPHLCILFSVTSAGVCVPWAGLSSYRLSPVSPPSLFVLTVQCPLV